MVFLKRSQGWKSLAVCALLTLWVCCGGVLSQEKAAPEDGGTEMIPLARQEKMLVVYFSATGVTKRIATLTAEAIGADLFEIAPEQPYSEADLDYRNPQSRSCREHNDPKIIPAYIKDVPDWDSYTAVLIGYPIWWGEAPNIVKGFVQQHDFAGKTVVPFCTSGSSGMGRSGVSLSRLGRWTQWLHGDCFAACIDDESVRMWAKGLLNGDGPRG